MTQVHFNPQSNLIILDVQISYKASRRVKMALDTGASVTVITPQVAKSIGYSEEQLVPSLPMTTASGSEQTAQITLRFAALFSEKIASLDARVFNLPSDLKIDGLLGLNFLRRFNITMNFEQGALTFQRISPAV